MNDGNEMKREIQVGLSFSLWVIGWVTLISTGIMILTELQYQSFHGELVEALFKFNWYEKLNALFFLIAQSYFAFLISAIFGNLSGDRYTTKKQLISFLYVFCFCLVTRGVFSFLAQVENFNFYYWNLRSLYHIFLVTNISGLILDLLFAVSANFLFFRFIELTEFEEEVA